MENQEMDVDQKKKTANDFIKFFLAIGGLIGALILLKYLMSAFHIL